jgi:hypothetical protein
MANPGLGEAERTDLVYRLMAARRAVRGAKQDADPKAEATAHKAVDEIKRALGERGPVWWDDGAPDLTRHMKRSVRSQGPFGEHAELPKNVGESGKKPTSKASPARPSARSPTRRPTKRPHRRTNASVSAASVKKPRKRRPGRRNANAGSRQSTRPRRLSTRRSRSIRPAPRRCEQNSRPSRRRSGPRNRNGAKKKSG